MKNEIGAAIDLGSTSIAVSLIQLNTGEEINTCSFPNPQISYGGDVITRIRYCMEDLTHLKELSDILWNALYEKITELLQDDFIQLRIMVISGNTTMLHILQNLSVKGLARAPFEPVTTDFSEGLISDKQMFSGVSVLYPPGFSAFVGGDILSGAQSLMLGQHTAYDLFVDLGTNGELLLINKDRGYASSTACGTVFDSAITGAGYGSDCIRAISQCLRRGLINKEGLLAAPYFETGICIDEKVTIKQQHIRNFQLAKGAIYAGILSLMKEAAIDFSDIGQLYISGGLGFYMNIHDAFTVKLLPKSLQGKIRVCGNTSLAGAKNLLLSKHNDTLSEILQEYQNLKSRTESIELANIKQFQSIFMESLNF